MSHKKLTLVLINTCVFCVLTFIFCLIMISLGEGRSVLRMLDLKVLSQYTINIGLGAFTILSIYNVKKYSHIIYGLFIYSVLYLSLKPFFESFDKVILTFNFIYALLAYYLYLLLKEELKAPYYNPNYSESELKSYKREFKLTIKKNENVFLGELTNWGEQGFFCRLSGEKPRGIVDFELTFKDKTFEGRGKVVFHSKTGVGIITNPVTLPPLGWSSFYGIIEEFGIKPQTD